MKNNKKPTGPNPFQLHIQSKYRTLRTPSKRELQIRQDRKSKNKGWD